MTAAAPAAPPLLPVTDPVLIVAIAAAVFLLVPLLFERMRLPGVVGLIVAGAVLGPHGTGVLARGSTMVLLGTVGLLYLMLLVGLELDLHELRRTRRDSIAFGALSFAVPATAGVGVALALGYRPASAALIGAVFSSHTLLAYPIASRLGILRNRAVSVTLAGTILTEVLALSLLAVVAGAARGAQLTPGFWLRLLLPMALYGAAVLWALPRLGRWFFRRVRAGDATEYVFVFAALFAVAALSHFAKLEPIVGALLAGLALNRLVPPHGPLMSRIRFVGEALLIPFFLLSVGMLVDVGALHTPRAWGIALALAAGTLASKGAAAWAAARFSGLSAHEAWVTFGLSVPHAAGSLAIVLVGFDLGLLDQTEVNAVVLTILATCLAGPWAVQRWGRRLALAAESAPAATGAPPRRILIPLANPARAEALVDLALALRGGATDEPLYPLVVVPDGPGREQRVAEGEAMMERAVLHAAAASVPVVPLTRVDENVATGIARGAMETRSAAVVVGWDGGRTAGGAIFGSVLDQLLDQTRQLVLVARLPHRLSTARRLVVVVPPGAAHHPGFDAALRAVLTLAAGSGAVVHGLAVAADARRLGERVAGLRPQVPATWEAVDAWRGLRPALEAATGPDDVVVLLGARRGTVHWDWRLERLPAAAAERLSGGLLVLYPPEAVDEPAAPAEPLLPDRAIRLADGRLEAVLGRLLAEAMPDAEGVRPLAESMARAAREYSTEIRPGVVVPHARAAGLDRSVLVAGTRAEGVDFPHARIPARVVLLLVSPAGRPDEHLRALAHIARLAADTPRLRELLARLDPSLPLDWLDAAPHRDDR